MGVDENDRGAVLDGLFRKLDGIEQAALDMKMAVNCLDS